MHFLHGCINLAAKPDRNEITSHLKEEIQPRPCIRTTEGFGLGNNIAQIQQGIQRGDVKVYYKGREILPGNLTGTLITALAGN